jgi:competence ComEA-like helix-hairpin-helix protein
MKRGSDQSALVFVAFLVALSAGARLLWPDPAPVVPADAAGVNLAAYEAKAQRALDAEKERQRPLAAGERIAVNRADGDELRRLPGVGASLAGRIIAQRRKGGFRTAADLTRVPGIGQRTAQELATHLDFSGAGAWGPAPARPAGRGGASLPAPASRYDSPARSGERAGVTASGYSPASGHVAGGAAADGTTAVDVNHASAAQLQTLHGIGPALARRIIAYRDSAGPFRTVDDLTAVPGIGPATLKRIRGRVRVGGGGGGP